MKKLCAVMAMGLLLFSSCYKDDEATTAEDKTNGTGTTTGFYTASFTAAGKAFNLSDGVTGYYTQLLGSTSSVVRKDSVITGTDTARYTIVDIRNTYRLSFSKAGTKEKLIIRTDTLLYRDSADAANTDIPAQAFYDFFNRKNIPGDMPGLSVSFIDATGKTWISSAVAQPNAKLSFTLLSKTTLDGTLEKAVYNLTGSIVVYDPLNTTVTRNVSISSFKGFVLNTR